MTSDGGIILGPGEGTAVAGSTGARFLIKADGDATRGTYSLIEASIPPGLPPVAAHVHHAHEESFFVLEGTVTLRLGEKTFPAPAGTFVLVPRGVAHTYANDTDAPARFLTTGSPAGLEGLFAAFARLRAQTPGGQLDFATIAAAGRDFDTEYLLRDEG